MTELVYVHDFEIMSGFIVLACLAILNGNFWAAVYIMYAFEIDSTRKMGIKSKHSVREACAQDLVSGFQPNKRVGYARNSIFLNTAQM